MSAELEARRTAAAAAADFQREVDDWTRHRTSSQPDMATWAFRLRDALGSLLGMPDPGAAQLAVIRAVFDVFDWETDDRQYALEQIEQIVTGGDEPAGPSPEDMRAAYPEWLVSVDGDGIWTAVLTAGTEPRPVVAAPTLAGLAEVLRDYISGDGSR
jgi:hypothetical protein